MTNTSHIFELIHCDIWDPYSIPSLDGSKYFLTIIDDYNRATWTYLMREKSQTKSLIHSSLYLIQTHFSCSVKILRSDNGFEFHMDDFYRSKGIIHQLSCVETAQQNGVVKRKHQHLLNIARSIKFQTNLPHQFWCDCIVTATHLLN